MSKRLAPLWRCPKCGERFVTRNLWHSCGKFSLTELLSRSEPEVTVLFKKFSKMVRACGRVKTIPQKTRVAFQVRMRFAACYPRKRYLRCTVVLERRLDSPRFARITEFSPQVVLHEFDVRSKDDLNEEVQSWLRESYEVGTQKSRLTMKPPSLYKR
jgi:Domain of unknown function (DUF5655)